MSEVRALARTRVVFITGGTGIALFCLHSKDSGKGMLLSFISYLSFVLTPRLAEDNTEMDCWSVCVTHLCLVSMARLGSLTGEHAHGRMVLEVP